MINKKYPYKRIYIEITNQCNLDCDFCHNTTRPLAMLLPRGFQYILNSLKNYSEYLYFHVKGEPLLHPKLEEFLRLSNEFNFKVQLVSNATLLKYYPASFWKHPALRKISLSLHSLDFHNQSEIDYFNEIINLINNSNCFVELRIWDYELINHSKRLNKLIKYFEDYYKITFQNESFQINKRLFVAYDKKFIWPTLTTPKDITYGTCLAYKLMLAILVDGKVVPCCLDGEGKIELGNIFSEDLALIINKPRYQNMIKGFKSNLLIEPLCQNCDYRKRFEKTPSF